MEQYHAASRRARDTRSRARKPKRRADFSLLLDIEEPLRDATHYVEALRLIGYGLVLHDEVGGEVGRRTRPPRRVAPQGGGGHVE